MMLYVIAVSKPIRHGDGKMKPVVIALLFSVTAFAYNTSYEKATFGKKSMIDSKKAAGTNNVLSVLIDTKSPDAARPIVKQVRGNACLHKETLINYSKYNRQTKMFEITYEVQFLVSGKGKTSCLFMIMPNAKASADQAAQVVIW